MKINWGTGVVIAFMGFIGFIMYFVVTMMTDKKYEHDLVTKEYYKQELNYQQEIDAEVNARSLPIQLRIEKTTDGLRVLFPETIDPSKIKGIVSLYRPSNKQLDFNLAISTSNNYLLIPDKRLLGGRWDIKTLWQYQGKTYLHKESIVY